MSRTFFVWTVRILAATWAAASLVATWLLLSFGIVVGASTRGQYALFGGYLLAQAGMAVGAIATVGRRPVLGAGLLVAAAAVFSIGLGALLTRLRSAADPASPQHDFVAAMQPILILALATVVLLPVTAWWITRPSRRAISR